jgi:hypothetical protein
MKIDKFFYGVCRKRFSKFRIALGLGERYWGILFDNKLVV